MGEPKAYPFTVLDLCSDIHEDLRLALNALDFVVNHDYSSYVGGSINNARALIESAQAKVLHIKSLQ